MKLAGTPPREGPGDCGTPVTGVGAPAIPGVGGPLGLPGGGAPCLDIWKALILAAMSGPNELPPLAIELAVGVGAGRLAALTLPNGVDEGVILVVMADVDMVPPGERRGRPGDVTGGEDKERSESESGNESGEVGDVGEEGEGRGEDPSSIGVDEVIVTFGPEGRVGGVKIAESRQELAGGKACQ